MSEPTDNDIPISCGECPSNFYIEGIKGMEAHILTVHKNYTSEEAKKYATAWMEDAYAAWEVQQAEHCAHMKGR